MFKRMVTIGVIVSSVMLGGCFGWIGTGEGGVRTGWSGKIDTKEIPDGFYTAFTDSVNTYSVREVVMDFKDMTPKAGDNLKLEDLDVTILYKASRDKLADLQIKYDSMTSHFEPGWAVVTRLARGAIYDSVSKYDSLTMHKQRDALGQSILEDLQGRVDASDPDTFTITQVMVRDLRTDSTIEQNIRDSVSIQKDTERVILADKQAEAEAKRALTEANGVAAANRAISESLTPALLEMRRIEMMAKLAQQGTHTVVLDTENSPDLILNPKN